MLICVLHYWKSCFLPFVSSKKYLYYYMSYFSIHLDHFQLPFFQTYLLCTWNVFLLPWLGHLARLQSISRKETCTHFFSSSIQSNSGIFLCIHKQWMGLTFLFLSTPPAVINLDILVLNQHLFLQTYIRKYTYNNVAQADTKFVQPSKVYWHFWFIGFLISEAKNGYRCSWMSRCLWTARWL